MKVNRDAVTIYFHCRYDAVKFFTVVKDNN
jgi:hypothetical protein